MCWKDSEDLKIGDRFQAEIEIAIRGYDKLLVILSGNSVSSMWVEREVQAAFEKERQHGSTVLFPVRLGDAVMECPLAWAAEIRRTRHIGDFRNLKARSFGASLQRLLRDLKRASKETPAKNLRTEAKKRKKRKKEGKLTFALRIEYHLTLGALNFTPRCPFNFRRRNVVATLRAGNVEGSKNFLEINLSAWHRPHV